MFRSFDINNKRYWKVRNNFKKLNYIFLNFFYHMRNNLILKKRSWKITNDLNKLTLKNSIASIIIVSIIFLLDYLVNRFIIIGNLKVVHSFFYKFYIKDTLFINLQVALLGVSGIFLGLYYSNMSSVFASRYAELPNSVSELFENEIVGNKYVELITSYIIVILLFLTINLIGIETHIVVLMYILYLTIRIVIAFSVLGKRVFRFSDFFAICNDIYVNIDQDIRNATIYGFKFDDNGFQQEYGNLCEKEISKIKEIAVIGLNEKNVKKDSIYLFLVSNLSAINNYHKQKKIIPHNSYWFKSINVYEPMHRLDTSRIQAYLNTGVPLTSKSKIEYYWFENQILDINNTVIDEFLKNNDFDLVLKYYTQFSDIFELVVDYNNTDYWINQIQIIYAKISNYVFDETNNDITLELADLYCGMLKSIILTIRKRILNIDLDIYKSFVEKNKFDNLSIVRSQLPLAKNKEFIDFINKLDFEYRAERRKITPNWLIMQIISNLYNNYIDVSINSLIKIYKSTFYQMIDELITKERYDIASICLANENEINNKFLNVILLAQQKSIDLKDNYKDNYYFWAETNYDLIIKELRKEHIKKVIQACKCTYSLFQIQYKFKSNVPDFYGMAYYNICEICFNAIVDNEYDLFSQSYPIALQNMIVQAWNIITDIKGNASPFAINAVSSSNIFIMEISGAAMLLSELVGDDAWTECVVMCFENIKKIYSDIDIAKDMIRSAKLKKGLPIGLYNTDLILNSWKLRFQGMVNENKLIKLKEGGHFYYKEIDSDSDVIKRYFSAHDSTFINIFGDFRDLFLIKVVNNYVEDKEKYEGRLNFE